MIRRLISFEIRPKLVIGVLLGFIAFTIIGTLSHELGHIAFAKALGYKTHLGYGYMNYTDGPYTAEFEHILKENKEAIKTDQPYAQKERQQELSLLLSKHSRWIIFGGPLQTVLTGTIAFFFLYRKRKQIQISGMKWVHWLLVFLSLFWLRETTNVVVGFLRTLSKETFAPFSGRSDELRLARWFGWWEGSISLPLALLGLGIGLYVIFKILPKPIRLTFITAGFAGGVLGYLIWLIWVGPIIMP